MKIHHWLPFLVFFILSFSAYNYFPPIWPDEALFFSPAFEYYANGILRTTVEAGLIPGMDTHTLWMPPVYFILLSKIFYIFPASIETGRIFSSVVAALSALILYSICRELCNKKVNPHFLFSILLTDFLFIRNSHIIRMESVCLFFGLVSLYFISRGFSNQERKLKIYETGFSGFFLGLSFLSHPFGIYFSVLIFIMLLVRKQFKPYEIGSIVVVFFITLIPWFIYVFPNWEIFKIQFGAQLARKKELLEKFGFFDKMKIIISSFYLPYLKIIVFFLLSINLLYIYIIKKWDKILSLFTGWFLITIIFLFISTESWYVYYLVPPLSLILYYLYLKKNFMTQTLAMLCLAYNLLVIGMFIYKNYIKVSIPKATMEYFSQIDKMVDSKKNIYLQAIPDPYFYLSKKYPDKNFFEFIPGELPIPDSFKNELEKTIASQDVFIFYNEDLMNNYIRDYLTRNINEFDKKFIYISSAENSDIKLEAVVYIKK